jgi:heme/copper-type cytochrome/quinol oxidase subunit 2
MNNEELTANREIISTGEWVLYIFLFSIPLINIIILCIWAFGNQSNPTKTHFGRAALIWIAIGIVLYIIFGLIIFSVFTTNMHTMHHGGVGV